MGIGHRKLQSRGPRRLVGELDKLAAIGISRDIGVVNVIGNQPGLRPHSNELALSNRNVCDSAARKAKSYGFVIHLVNGLVFSILYVLIFEARHTANWWFGAILGLAHALMILTVGMSLMPGIHPRMASEQHGPNANRQLEPPGFMALNYGVRTPVSVFLAHAVFGAILGSLYHLAGA